MPHFKPTLHLRQLFLTLTAVLSLTVAHGQTNSCENIDRALTKLYKKIFPFYYDNHDSLNYYSELFSSKLTDYIKSNPSTLQCKFKTFTDSVGSIVTTNDGALRIYSWDTWTGGTMHRYENLFQFKSGDTVYAKDFNYGDGDMGTYFTAIYPLSANGKNYFLSIAGGSESSKDRYEFIKVYSISTSSLNDSVPLIKTPSGLSNSIVIEYDIFSTQTPLDLIKYDTDKKIIYIPIILEGGKVTDRFILYQFNGQYFEKILTQKK